MTSTKAHYLLHDAKPGDIIKFRRIMRRPATDTTHTAKITRIDKNREGGWQITYMPCDRPDSVRCAFGSRTVKPGPQSPWGWQTLDIVGHEKDAPPLKTPCLKGNPGYDLTM